MGPRPPAAARRGDARVRAVVAWCAGLLAVLGVLAPAAPGGFPVPGPGSSATSGAALGPAAAEVVPYDGGHSDENTGRDTGEATRTDSGADRERAGALCATVACDGQPRLNRAGPAERFAGASGAALLPERLLPATPGCDVSPVPSAGGGTHVEEVRCPDGRAPPTPPGT